MGMRYIVWEQDTCICTLQYEYEIRNTGMSLLYVLFIIVI